MEQMDAVIIGGGQAGIPLSQDLANRGWKVALIEREHLGGSCINYGCTPTKAMLASAKIAHHARRSAEYGVHTGDVGVNIQEVVQRKNEIVASKRKNLREKAQNHENITLIDGEAYLSGDYQVKVNGRELSADKIFINTGTRAKILPIEGLDQIDYLTNKTILDITVIPDHLIVIGGNYIGLEFGQMFRRFGSQVTVIETNSHIAKHEDPEISTALQSILEVEGIQFLLNHKANSVRKDQSGVIHLTAVSSQNGEDTVISGSHLLMAAGREPNTRALQLENAGIEHQDGWIRVNDYLETNVPGVYALGDIKGGPMFTHLSYNDYQIVYHNLFHADKMSWRDRIIPYTLYTDPELGRVGLSEKQAREEGKDIRVASIPMKWVARAIERGETEGLMKVVVDANSQQILGAAILAAEGGELVQTLMALMLAKAPWTVFHKAVFIHPTLTEGFFTLMDQLEA